MLNRIKKAVANATKGDNNDETPTPKTEKFVYSRPYFLGLSKDEVDNSRDFGIRPIFIPRNFDKTHKLPFNAGYAEYAALDSIHIKTFIKQNQEA